ncbi:heterokaryon incompatibility protein-domain-containing protein [Cercophora samala]|uniref:Heterokaryon incompatibility protein-domain-containing protein n=1 Tax=Cercophora samala TaxID=330535 RepID=A0AA40DD43_9PEZI|nr:heterokaryon incompatibility protein-domain-containing protein [Cercophora samala]
MSDLDSLPVHDGPRCNVCYDLLATDQHRKQFYHVLELSDIYKSAETCPSCAVIIEALESIEGPAPTLADRTTFTVEGELGQPLRLKYKIDDVQGDQMIEVFTTGEPDNCIGRLPLVEPEITPGKAARIARMRLRECLDSHEGCAVDKKPFIPTRLVRVGSVHDLPCLVETTEDMKTDDYIALSYCWGLSQVLTTTKDTLQSRLGGTAWEDIPKTLREAIEFVQSLGLSYIWIDALCIIQDDNLDWEREAAQMKNIYENALFTLSATSAPDVNTGCFLARSNRDMELQSAKPEHTYYARRVITDTHKTLFSYGDNTVQATHKYPALTRGWIYQERLLSKRILYCAVDELIWECQTSIRCECSHESLHHRGSNPIVHYKQRLRPISESMHKDPQGDSKVSLHEIIWAWSTLVESYSQRAFTKYTDRLVALSGIADKFQPLNIGTYHAGIWTAEIHHQLAWSRFTDMDKLHQQEGTRIPSFPSWSWASITQPCKLDITDPAEISTRLTFLNCQTIPNNPNSPHPTSQLRLSISAPCVKGKILLSSTLEDSKGSWHRPRVEAIRAQENNPDRPLTTYVSYREKRYRLIADVLQWDNNNNNNNKPMQPEDILTPLEEVLCLELYSTDKAGDASVDPDAPAGNHSYRFPWLVVRWSPLQDAYRRVGIINFDNGPCLDRECEEAPGEMMRHAVVRAVDIV